MKQKLALSAKVYKALVDLHAANEPGYAQRMELLFFWEFAGFVELYLSSPLIINSRPLVSIVILNMHT